MKRNKKKRFYRLDQLYVSLVNHVKRDKKAFLVFSIMQLITIFVFIRSLFLHQYEITYICALAFIMFLAPSIIEKGLKIDLPTPMEITAYIFVFCAEFLGEIGCYYIKYKFWDTMLHTISGFMFAAFGFCLVDLFNRTERFKFRLSAGFLAVVAFCFSMTIGIFWEFGEFAADNLTRHDMQKDTLVKEIKSVALDDSSTNVTVVIPDIEKTIVVQKDGTEVVIEGGYLELGLRDTMTDLFVNFIGASLFCIVGYFYIKHRGKIGLAAGLIPVIEEESVFSKRNAEANNASEEQTPLTEES